MKYPVHGINMAAKPWLGNTPLVVTVTFCYEQ